MKLIKIMPILCKTVIKALPLLACVTFCILFMFLAFSVIFTLYNGSSFQMVYIIMLLYPFVRHCFLVVLAKFAYITNVCAHKNEQHTHTHTVWEA